MAKAKERDDRRMTFIIVPHSGDDMSTRSFEINYRQLRVAAIVAGVLGTLLLVMAVSWFWVAAQAARVPVLERQVSTLQRERERVEELSRVVARLEAQYGRVRAMLGGDVPRDSVVRDTMAGEQVDTTKVTGGGPQASLPRDWPLVAQGFVTREMLGQAGAGHPGLDIAVATGSAIRASGSGVVTAAGEDPVYGRFVRIAHSGGYESLYGHASRLLVGAHERVRRDQVIALSGSTGASTAPHLHFEIRKDGSPVDPRRLVHNPW
ncbi:MAG TPA: M23 family metallopeptidase [Longimicrobiaceae bacterium]|nr:M23 family metallopeptidase [Longimicrobiaceae bacterium]